MALRYSCMITQTVDKPSFFPALWDPIRTLPVFVGRGRGVGVNKASGIILRDRPARVDARRVRDIAPGRVDNDLDMAEGRAAARTGRIITVIDQNPAGRTGRRGGPVNFLPAIGWQAVFPGIAIAARYRVAQRFQNIGDAFRAIAGGSIIDSGDANRCC